MAQKATKNKMLSPTDLSDKELDQIVHEEDPRDEACLPDPDELEGEDDDSSTCVDEAVELVREIGEMAADVPEAGENYAESVVTKSLSIQQTIEENEKATPGQLTALRNMKAGLEKWIR